MTMLNSNKQQPKSNEHKLELNNGRLGYNRFEKTGEKANENKEKETGEGGFVCINRGREIDEESREMGS